MRNLLQREKSSLYVTFNCPYCDAEIHRRAGSVKAGKTMLCPACAAGFPIASRELRQALASLERQFL